MTGSKGCLSNGSDFSGRASYAFPEPHREEQCDHGPQDSKLGGDIRDAASHCHHRFQCIYAVTQWQGQTDLFQHSRRTSQVENTTEKDLRGYQRQH